MFKKIVYLSCFVFVLFSCSNDNTQEEPSNIIDQEPLNETDRLEDDILTIGEGEMALGYFPDTETPYIFIDENLYSVVAYDRDLDSNIDGVLLKNGDVQALAYLDAETYLPTTVSSSEGDAISFLYSEDLTSVDVIFHYPDKDDIPVTIETNPEDLDFGQFNKKSTKKVNKKNELST